MSARGFSGEFRSIDTCQTFIAATRVLMMVFLIVRMLVVVTTGLRGYIILQTDRSFFMMMMGNDRYSQHKYADHAQQIGNVPSFFHPLNIRLQS